MKLIVGFVTYNDFSAKYLDVFLPNLRASLEFLTAVDKQILVVDNSSLDNNINRLAMEHFTRDNPAEIIYFPSKENIGFGPAFNILINKAKELGAEYFLIINPDVLLEIDTIEKLITKLDSNKNLASVSPKILRWDFVNKLKTKQIDSCGIILRTGLRFNDLGQGEIDSGQYDQANILGPSGAAGMFRLRALEQIKDENGYFDARFFMYKEDCDLAYRLNKSGLISALVPDALAYHDRTVAFYGKGIGAFMKNRRQVSQQARAWSFKNQHLLFVKYFKNENSASRVVIVTRILLLGIFSLILEQFNLKQYSSIFKFKKA
jgi:GT2 family glycosyltransferase